MAQTQEFTVIRLQPDSKAAESLSRRLWKGRSKSQPVKNTAGRRVYQHAGAESRKE
jgi:hypothetical protein